jgi:hypothetical protein
MLLSGHFKDAPQPKELLQRIPEKKNPRSTLCNNAGGC